MTRTKQETDPLRQVAAFRTTASTVLLTALATVLREPLGLSSNLVDLKVDLVRAREGDATKSGDAAAPKQSLSQFFVVFPRRPVKNFTKRAQTLAKWQEIGYNSNGTNPLTDLKEVSSNGC